MNFTEQERLLIEPYGGKLVNLRVSEEEREELRSRAQTLPRLHLTTRNVCDLELLATGGFSPLETFMGEADYHRVLEQMRLANGLLFPVPVTLTARKDPRLKLDSEIALADQRNNLLSVLRVEDIYEWDRECEASYGTNDMRHPMVAEMNSWGEL